MVDSEMKQDLPLVPERERLDAHQFDVEAEHASGWSLKSQKPKPIGGDVDPETNPMDALIIRDAGEVNRVQYDRIKELKMPLSDTGAQTLPVSIRSGNAPDFKARDPNDVVQLTTASITTPEAHVPVAWVNEAAKMGLSANTNALYLIQAHRIRMNDRKVGTDIKASMNCNDTRMSVATDITSDNNSKQGGYGKAYKDRRNTRYNPLITAGQPLSAKRFNPIIRNASTNQLTETPGSAAAVFVSRDDSSAGDELEKIVVINPEATQNALDRGIFSPAFRNFGEYPAMVRARLTPKRK